MRFRNITATYAVDGQVTPADMKTFAAEGFRTVINNRPDGEEAGQASEAELRAAAEAEGLSYHFVPMTMPTLTPETVREHDAAIRAADGPVLAFCRSGTRSTMLWALGEFCFHGRPLPELVAAAAAGGYDLSTMGPLLENYREALKD